MIKSLTNLKQFYRIKELIKLEIPDYYDLKELENILNNEEL